MKTNVTRMALVAGMLTMAAIAATPTASAWKFSGACTGQYNQGGNSTSPHDDYCLGVWQEGPIECVGIYFPGSEPPECIGIEPKPYNGSSGEVAVGVPSTAAFEGDPLAA